MPAFTSTAPGKIILFGEHAVVYNQPAIAVPVNQVQARAVVMADPKAPTGRIWIQAPDIQLDTCSVNLPEEHPLARLIQVFLRHFSLTHIPACILRITSTIPIAAGMGSGAAISVASLRALSAFIGVPLAPEKISALAYEIEKIYHGTPSGIDNTVIALNKPVYYVRGMPITTFSIGKPFTLVIGDTGIRSPTSRPVEAVRQAWMAEPERYEALFARTGEIAITARKMIETGQIDQLGGLMDANQALLSEMGVSHPGLDRLIGSARRAGASGAKLSGGGWGGNMIALVEPHQAQQVAAELMENGAERILISHFG